MTPFAVDHVKKGRSKESAAVAGGKRFWGSLGHQREHRSGRAAPERTIHHATRRPTVGFFSAGSEIVDQVCAPYERCSNTGASFRIEHEPLTLDQVQVICYSQHTLCYSLPPKFSFPSSN